MRLRYRLITILPALALALLIFASCGNSAVMPETENPPTFTPTIPAFKAENMLLTMVLPLGTGNVTRTPSGAYHEEGTRVSLTAVPASGYAFDHWSGDASGSSATITITMGSNKGTTAHFTLAATVSASVPQQAYQQHFEQGNVYLNEKLWDEAISAYTQAIELNPEYANAYAKRAVAYLEDINYHLWGFCEYGGVISDIEKAKTLNPAITLDAKLAYAYTQQGDCDFDKRDYEESIINYTKALELDPNISSRRPIDVYSELIYDSLTYQEYDKAIEYANKAIALNTGDNDYYYRKLAEAYHGRGDEYAQYWEPDKAIAEYTKAIELDPTNANYYLSRGFVYYEWASYYNDAGQTFKEAESNNKAIADYTMAIELGVEGARIYIYRGNCYAGISDYASAIADFTMVIELGSELIDFGYFNRGNAYESVGNNQKAIADYKKVVEITDNDFLKEQSQEYMKKLQ